MPFEGPREDMVVMVLPAPACCTPTDQESTQARQGGTTGILHACQIITQESV